MNLTNNNITCPTDHVYVNENQVRLNAFLVFSFMLAFMFFNSFYIMLFLVLDFGLRSFDLGKYSIINLFNKKMIQLLKIKNKPVDRAPKRFAARIGLIFCVLILVLNFLNINTLLPAGVIVIFAALESFVGFCAGCYVYSFVKKISF